MTPTDLLNEFPFDPSKRGLESNYVLPRKLIAIEDEPLRRAVAEAWLWSPAGKDWARSREVAARIAAEIQG